MSTKEITVNGQSSPLIGILGGTFDPVHNGHLHVARELLRKLPLKEICFIPCYQPSHRPAPAASAEQRLQMVKLAITDENAMTVDDCEIKRTGISYTIDTIHQLKQQHPRQTLCLIIGSDAWQQFSQWRHSNEILQLAHIVIVNRGKDMLRHLSSSIELLNSSASGQTIFCTIPPCFISASAIRQKPITAAHDCLPAAVYQYILQHHLYSTNTP